MSNLLLEFQKNKIFNRLYLILKVNGHLILSDFSLLFPVTLGIISLFGICFSLLLAGFPRRNVQAAPVPTAIPFKYLLLATEAVLPTQESQLAMFSEIAHTSNMDLTENVIPTPTFDQQNGNSTALTRSKDTEINASDIPTLTFTNTPSPIFTGSEPMALGKYDASDSHIIVNGNWVNQSNVSVSQGDLLISNTVGNHVAFRFIGRQMVLGYQSDANAGEMSINIDGSEMTISQLVGNAWFSQKLDKGTHFVILTHTSGGSINLVYVEVSG